MDRTLVLTLQSRQRDMFDDVQLILDDVGIDNDLATTLLEGIMGTPPPPRYKIAEDIIAVLEDELREFLRDAGVYELTRGLKLDKVERSPRNNNVSIFVRVTL